MSGAAKATGGQTVRGFLWTASSFGVQAVAQFAVLALLARFLTPVEFGLVSAALVVIGLVRIVTDSVVGPAVTQLRDLTPIHVRAAFSLCVYVGAIAAIALWLSSGAVAALFRIPQMASVVRGLAPFLVIDALSTVPIALLQRELQFRTMARVEAVSFLAGFALPGCVLAFGGAGVWSLVVAQLAYAALRSVLMLLARPHPYSFALPLSEARDILRFGSGHTLARFFNYTALQADYFVVGRWLSAASLGFYGRAYQLAVKPAMFLGQAVDKVLFPSMASLQDDRRRLARAFTRTISLATAVAAPASVAGVVLAPEIVRVVLGGGWEDVIVPFQILVAGLLPRTAYKPCDSLAKASGHVYRRAWRQAVYAILVFTGALVGSRWGLPAVAAFVLGAIVINYAFMAALSVRVVDMRWRDFVRAHARGGVLAVATAAVVVPTAAALRAAGGSSFLVLLGSVGALALVGGFAVRRDPARVLGADVMWLLDRSRRRAGGSTPPTERPAGSIIAVVGADGSGKSTLTRELVEELDRTASAQHLYLGSGDGPAAWYRAPLKLARRVVPRLRQDKSSAGTGTTRQARRPAVLRFVWASVLAVEKVGKTRRAARARADGTVVVCDRYPQLQFPGGNDGPLLAEWSSSRSPILRSVAQWERQAYMRAVAVTPDLVLKLDVPLRVGLERRPGLERSYLEPRIALIRALDFPCPTITLDAAEDRAVVRARALAAIEAHTGLGSSERPSPVGSP